MSMKRTQVYIHFFALLSVVASIAYTPMAFAATKKLQDYILLITDFIGNTLIPFFFALALFFFLVNMTRFFILKGGDAYARDQARTFAMYGLIAFVFLVSIWGITNIILGAFDLDEAQPICPDYICPRY